MRALFQADAAIPHCLPAWSAVCIATLISVTLLPSAAMAQSGDMNCNGAVNTADIPLFVDALLASGTFGGCDINRADMNADGQINGRDVQAFVSALLAPQCPAGQALCGGACIDVMWDNANCGACGNVCPPQSGCTFGVCHGSCVGCEP